MRRCESGFTLIELMMTVAVISILAAIAVPSFFGETRKATASAEVRPMFNDFRVRLEQYMQERGTYPPTVGEATLNPAGTPSTTPQDLNPLPADWAPLKLRISGPDKVRCAYTYATGTPADIGNIGPIAGGSTAPPPVGFGFTAPATDWFYLLAKCDMDGINDGTDATFSWYFTSSVDPRVQILNEGK